MNLKYTQHQQKAIDHWEGNLQIIACAGSGKTDVITRRIAKLVTMGVQTREIVAFYVY
ncbi:MAG: UvrD-helicase domain-containing protein [Candidatus Heimdallarchaeota archaeon]